MYFGSIPVTTYTKQDTFVFIFQEVSSLMFKLCSDQAKANAKAKILLAFAVYSLIFFTKFPLFLGVNRRLHVRFWFLGF